MKKNGRKKEEIKRDGRREGGRKKEPLYWFYLYWICNVEFRI